MIYNLIHKYPILAANFSMNNKDGDNLKQKTIALLKK